MGRYVSLISAGTMGGSSVLFSPSRGGETAGSIARSTYRYGGETAGSIASSTSGGSSSCSTSSCGGSFTAVA